MFYGKYKFACRFISMLLVLGLTLSVPACQKSTETGEPPASPEQQAETEGTVASLEQPDETEGTSAPAEQRVALSFEAAEYTNAELGFAVKYPEEWLEQPIEEPTPTVFSVASAKRVPALRLS